MSETFVPRGRTSSNRRARSSTVQDRDTNAEDTPIPDAEPLANQEVPEPADELWGVGEDFRNFSNHLVLDRI